MSELKPGADRLAQALRAASDDSRPGKDCPPAERIWDAAHLQLPRNERCEIIDHTIGCPTCAEAWRMAMELRIPRETVGVGRPTRRAFLTRPGSWRWLSAAAVAMAVAAAVIVLTPRVDVKPSVRDPRTGAIQSLIEGGVTLPRDDVWLRWSGGTAGARFDLTVTTSDLEVVVMVRGLERSEYRIPPERLAELPPGARLFWRVVARAPTGGTTPSPTFEIAVK